jgi:hypothetical protein
MALTPKKLDAVRPTVPVDEVGRQTLVRVNINVPEVTRKQWKMAAIERGVSLGTLIENAVNETLSKTAKV